jgi:DNA polymerase/3'-5' exonuclease PolX
MKLEAAQQLARHLVDYMRPACDRIEVAGSVRRESAEVKDIEIVCIAKFVERPQSFSLLQETYTANLLFEDLKECEFIQWIKPGATEIEKWHIKPDGKYWRGLIRQGRFDTPSDIKLDLFLARPKNWGVIYTIRTGSPDFSRALVTYARDKTDYRVDGGNLLYRGQLIECREETLLFQSLNLEWIEPRARGGERDLLIQH